MSPVPDQLGLTIIPSPTPPVARVTISSSTIHIGDKILLGAWVTNSSVGQVPCLVEFFMQQGNFGVCAPVSIAQDIGQTVPPNAPLPVINPTAPVVLNSGAPAIFFSFLWVVQGQAGPTKFYAQARAVDQSGVALGLPCPQQPWNAVHTCNIEVALPTTMTPPREMPASPPAYLYEAFAVSNREHEEAYSKFSVTAVSPDEVLDEPSVKAEIDRLREEGFIFSVPNRLTSFLGKERALRPEGADRAWLNRAGAIAPGEFLELRDSEPLDDECTLPLIAGEARQVLLELSRSREIERPEFYVVRVRTEVKDQVWERLRIFRSHNAIP
jgi:hypothetical protein